jgi:hypothetical protein
MVVTKNAAAGDLVSDDMPPPQLMPEQQALLWHEQTNRLQAQRVELTAQQILLDEARA